MAFCVCVQSETELMILPLNLGKFLFDELRQNCFSCKIEE